MEAFVYIWRNLTNGKKYVGYHKGTIDDGYVSSSHSNNFWEDFNNPEMKWVREIISFGSKEECLQMEQLLLENIDIRSDEWYNNARGAQVIFTEEVRKKIRDHHMGKSSGMLGKSHSSETKELLSQKLKGRSLSEEHRENLKKPKSSIENYRKPKTEEHKAAMRKPKEKVECPHCKTLVPVHLKNRWHFNNCKVN